MDVKSYATLALLLGFGLIAGSLMLGLYIAKRQDKAQKGD